MENFNLILPQNYIAEEILIGSIFIHPYILNEIISLIKIEYFFLEKHKIIYTYLISTYKRKSIYFYDILSELSKDKILYKIGGTNKIVDLMKQSQIFNSSFIFMNNYIKELIVLIQYNYIRRLMIQYGYNIIKLAYIPKKCHHNIYNKASLYLNNTKSKLPENKTDLINNTVKDFILNIKNNVNERNNNKNSHNFYSSGFKKLDLIISGLIKGDLIIIAGRPSTGKTSLAISIIYNLIIKLSDTKICLFSLEMSKEQILCKLLSAMSSVPLKNIISKDLNQAEWNNIIQMCYKILEKQIYIYNEINISVDYISYTSQLLNDKDSHIDLIIIDYLQLIQTSHSYKNNRSQELGYITRKLKILAQYIKTPIIVLSQLNRNIEYRSNKKPILSDLKESGCIDLSNYISLTNKLQFQISLFYLFSCYKILKQFYYNNKYIKTYIFCDYLFMIKISVDRNILITYNHMLISKKDWSQQLLSLKNSNILVYKNIKNHIKYYKPLKSIKFFKYKKSYDLYIPINYYYLNNQTILHNSIEQDADIIIMMYHKSEIDKNMKEKIIEIIVCKNRNGPIGETQLKFLYDTTLFREDNLEYMK
uniref:DNA 5'-3' helicase n=1 Tax=Taenioma perpusillum TaxID=210852 RepID=A0A1Z1MR56_9FLOR|nr:Replication helicase subunit [Taenioma perpusillum]ARW68583.1 Replication helicase subunit [Taenioma perpusillum]